MQPHACDFRPVQSGKAMQYICNARIFNSLQSFLAERKRFMKDVDWLAPKLETIDADDYVNAKIQAKLE